MDIKSQLKMKVNGSPAFRVRSIASTSEAKLNVSATFV
jgi:hypothetical protein